MREKREKVKRECRRGRELVTEKEKERVRRRVRKRMRE